MNALQPLVVGVVLSLGLVATAEPDVIPTEGVGSPPLFTEPSAYTIGRGRVAFEFSPFDLALDKRNPDRADVRTTSWRWPVLFKYGLLDDLDLQIGVDALVSERTVDRDEGTKSRRTGFGETTLLLKWNLFGNHGADDGDFALALRPELILPTARSGLGSRALQGGVTVPMQYYLPWDLELSWAPGFHAVRNSDDDGYEFGFASLVSLYVPFTERIWGMLEFDSWVTTENGDPWQGAINVGLSIDVNDDLVFEFGTLIGVTRSADDVNVYATIAKRF